MQDWQAKLMWTISASFLQDTVAGSLEPAVQAANGDLSAWNRLIANSTRAMLPMSGAAGVLAKAISSSQKDLESDVLQYLSLIHI